jgi:fatty acid CoA ligase FadD9
LYRDLRPAVLKIASGLRKFVDRGAHVAICGFNTIEWALCDFACAVAGLVSVGIHSNYEEKEAISVLNHSEAQIIIVSEAYLQLLYTTSSELLDNRRLDTAWKLPTILSQLLHAKAVILMDTTVEVSTALFLQHKNAFSSATRKIAVDSIARFLAEESETEMCESLEDDPSALFTLLYTSGSSGKPKAVEQSRSAFFDGVSMSIYVTPLITVSYIPLSHSSDRFKLWTFLSNGGRVGFAFYSAKHWQQHETVKKDAILRVYEDVDDVKESGTTVIFGGVIKLFESISLVQPSGLALPPNIWNHLYSLSRSGTLADSQDEANKVIKSWFGPFVKEVITGGAPTNPDILHWARRMLFPIDIHDSYGITEIGEVCKDNRPASGIQVKLVDVPELGLFHPYGEIWILKSAEKRSTAYFKDPESSALSFSDDGWFRTGDVGIVDNASQTFQVIDRVSAVYGVRVESKITLLSPAVVEDKILQLFATNDRMDINNTAALSDDVVDCFVHVTTTAPITTGGVPGAAAEVVVVLVIQPLDSNSPNQDSKNKDALAVAWLQKIKHLAETTDKLLPHEIPSRLISTSKAFSIDNRMLTPSFKKARKVIISSFFGPQ